ncbi:MAG: nicotinate-nucleotide--dimethylbenzimidazole phosphoribosyltransferase [Bacteroidetes bacterium]|jgi:nicotinate-nucleotide--dimethylbenzimidazole phosphoribosyltransferase|nr:nicotinate-nucleotide--dimethylbenzimidazole phosphoribosyltransferase [Bacteroidota bacterium]
MRSFSSASHIQELIQTLPDGDDKARSDASTRQSQLTKPPGALGRLEQIAIWMAFWQARVKPTLNHGQCLVFAGNHGVINQGISPFPAEVTQQMVWNFEAGGAAINQLCIEAGLKLTVTALELNRPTADFTTSPAMDPDEVLHAMNAGAAAIDKKCDYLIVGEMGIGNTTSAAALCMGRFGGDAAGWVGPGTGLDEAGVNHKTTIVQAANDRHGRLNDDPVLLLAAYGGRELAAIAGAVLEARMRRIPVMLDGFISTAAAAALTAGNRLDVLDHCMISHLSAEPGHVRLATALRKQPIVDLRMRLGEGSGAAVATLLVRAALATHNGMATFAEAGVSAET